MRTYPKKKKWNKIDSIDLIGERNELAIEEKKPNGTKIDILI